VVFADRVEIPVFADRLLTVLEKRKSFLGEFSARLTANLKPPVRERLFSRNGNASRPGVLTFPALSRILTGVGSLGRLRREVSFEGSVLAGPMQTRRGILPSANDSQHEKHSLLDPVSCDPGLLGDS